MDNAELKVIIDSLNRVYADLRARSPNTVLQVHRARLRVVISVVEDEMLATQDQDLVSLLRTMGDRARRYLDEIDGRLGGRG